MHTGAAKGPTVVKAHFVGPTALRWLRTSHAKAICTYRDPRDCVASDRMFLKWDMARIIDRVRGNFQAMDEYGGCSNVLMVRYEDMMKNRLAEIRRIAGHLEVEVSDATLRRIDGETNLQSSLKVCQSLKHYQQGQFNNVESHRVDPVTQLHDNHIYNSKVGRWQNELSEDVGNVLTSVFKPWLLKFGYDVAPVRRANYVLERMVDFSPEHSSRLTADHSSSSAAYVKSH